VRIARWYCPEGRRTFSLIPDFLAARLPGLLAAIEKDVIEAGSARSTEAAADVLRGLDISLPCAVRWLRRRVTAVRASISAAAAIAPRWISSLMTEVTARRCPAPVLLRLRTELAPEILDRLPPPLGFQRARPQNKHSPDHQHDVGPDPDCDPQYAASTKGIRSWSSCTPTRAYRDTLKLLFEFAAQHHSRVVASLTLADLDADLIAGFLDHLETNRSNSATTRNCRRAPSAASSSISCVTI
jgi:hypothetical protein